MLGLNWLKIALYGGSALLVIGMLWTINSWRVDSNHLETVTAERDKVVSDHNAYIATRAAQDSITAKVSTDYENAITDLVGQLEHARGTVPSISVHHCASQNTVTTTASRPDATAQDGSDRPHDEVVTVSTDEPLNIASEAATCGKRLNSLQDWIRQQAALN